MSDSLQDLYTKYLKFTDLMLEEHQAEQVAAILVTQGLSMYKTILSEEAYERMVTSIYSARNEVKEF